MPKIAIVVLFDKTLKNVILQYIPNWIRLSVIITHPPAAAAGSSDIVAKSTYFLRNVPYKRFPKQGAKKLCPFRFSLCVCYLCLKIETHSRLQSSRSMCKITGLCNHSLCWTYLPNYFHFLANFEHSLLCKFSKMATLMGVLLFSF